MAQTYKVLKVEGPNNCQYFNSMDVWDVAGNHLKHGYYVVTQSGMQQGGFDWCRALVAGGEYYVVILPGHSALLNMTLAQFEDYTRPGYMYRELLDRISAANTAIAEEKLFLQTAQASTQAANQAAETHSAAKHAAEADAKRIEGKIEALGEFVAAQLDVLKNDTRQGLEAQQNNVNTKAAVLRMDAAEKSEAVKGEAKRQCETLGLRLDRMRDPVSGRVMPVPSVAESLFGLHREESLTAREYHELQMPAGEYAQREVDAYAYATRGKALLA